MSNSQKTLIIAEAGVNHNGDVKLAKKLIDVAADAGANLVKFQTFNAERLATENAPKAHYQEKTTGKATTQLEMLRKLELSPRMHQALMEYCHSRNIGFFSTGFDIESINFLALIGAELFKVPSGEITNLPYLRHIGSFKKPLILSTGMATLGEIEAALDALEAAGSSRADVTVLHCNTDYPTKMSDVNLRAMCSIREAFGVAVGYSDHTLGIEVPIAAVALGAKVIEKHLTIDRKLPGPDHRASLEPDEFASMVCSIRNIEQALGDGIKRPSQSEMKNRNVARKSLVAAKPIQAGEYFSAENVTAKRPGDGISPMQWDNIVGRQAKRSFVTNEMIEL